VETPASGEESVLLLVGSIGVLPVDVTALQFAFFSITRRRLHQRRNFTSSGPERWKLRMGRPAMLILSSAGD